MTGAAGREKEALCVICIRFIAFPIHHPKTNCQSVKNWQ